MSNNPGGLSPENWNQISSVQAEIHRWADAQFPHRTDHHAIYKLVVEEIPELMMHKKEKGTENIGLELADAFILLMDLASMWDVNLATAIRAKMEINYNRTWVMGTNGIMQHVPVQDDSAAWAVCPNCNSNNDTRRLTQEEYALAQEQWGNSDCPYNSLCLKCKEMFDDGCPF